ncbi:MAG: hypothetical protein WC792_01720 [Candidatus Micrarchaeia archaeon]|jgi:hypothetical protein
MKLALKRNRQILKSPVVGVKSTSVSEKEVRVRLGHFLRAFKEAGLKVDEMHQHDFTFKGRIADSTERQWHSVRVSHPSLSGKKLRGLVSEAAKEGISEFYRSKFGPSHHMETVLLSSKGDWKKFANGKFPLPHKRGSVVFVAHAYNFVS